MKAEDRRLLTRMALRMEKAALEKYEAAVAATPVRADEAKRTRDHELGDVRDVRDYVKRADRARVDSIEAAAKVCDSRVTHFRGVNDSRADEAASCAEDIRALLVVDA